MQDTIDIDRLSLDLYRAQGRVPRATPELRRRIQGHGCIDPIVVRPSTEATGRYDIISNAETYVAAGRLGITRVPVVVLDDLDEDEANEIVRGQNLADEHNPIDEAEWLQEKLAEQLDVHECKPSISRLARLTGKSRTQISRALSLLTLPTDVQSLFRSGRLSAAHGRFLVKIKNTTTQKRLAKRAADEGLSVRDLKAIIESKQDVPEIPVQKAPQKDPDTLRLERDLTGLVGCPVSIEHDQGLLSIRYFGNFETLEGILLRLGHKPD